MHILQSEKLFSQICKISLGFKGNENGIFISRSACSLKGPFHPAFFAHFVSWLAFVVANFMAHENGDKQRPTKRQHVQRMLDETDPLKAVCPYK